MTPAEVRMPAQLPTRRTRQAPHWLFVWLLLGRWLFGVALIKAI